LSPFERFIASLRKDGFDVSFLDRKKIEDNLGRGMYRNLAIVLKVLNHRKVTFIFQKETKQASWPSVNYPDRIVVNLARFPTEEILKNTEKELLELQAAIMELKK
jgi:hypothetical protein